MRAALRQAWELDDAAKADRLIRNLARRLEQAPGVAASIPGWSRAGAQASHRGSVARLRLADHQHRLLRHRGRLADLLYPDDWLAYAISALWLLLVAITWWLSIPKPAK